MSRRNKTEQARIYRAIQDSLKTAEDDARVREAMRESEHGQASKPERMSKKEAAQLAQAMLASDKLFIFELEKQQIEQAEHESMQQRHNKAIRRIGTQMIEEDTRRTSRPKSRKIETDDEDLRKATQSSLESYQQENERYDDSSGQLQVNIDGSRRLAYAPPAEEVTVPGDGACLFWAMLAGLQGKPAHVQTRILENALQLLSAGDSPDKDKIANLLLDVFHPTATASLLRKLVVKYVVANWGKFVGFQCNDREHYQKNMSKNGNNAGHIEISAVQDHILGIPLVIVKSSDPTPKFDEKQRCDPDLQIWLAFHDMDAHGHMSHYNAILSVDDRVRFENLKVNNQENPFVIE